MESEPSSGHETGRRCSGTDGNAKQENMGNDQRLEITDRFPSDIPLARRTLGCESEKPTVAK